MEEKRATCSKCEQTFEGKCAVGNKNKHEKKCPGPKYVCNTCQPQKVFKNFKKEFVLHLQEHEQKAQRVVAICNNCKLNFQTLQQLSEHKNTEAHKTKAEEGEDITEFNDQTVFAICSSTKRKERTDKKELRVLNIKRPKRRPSEEQQEEEPVFNLEEVFQARTPNLFGQEEHQLTAPISLPLTPFGIPGSDFAYEVQNIQGFDDL